MWSIMSLGCAMTPSEGQSAKPLHSTQNARIAFMSSIFFAVFYRVFGQGCGCSSLSALLCHAPWLSQLLNRPIPPESCMPDALFSILRCFICRLVLHVLSSRCSSDALLRKPEACSRDALWQLWALVSLTRVATTKSARMTPSSDIAVICERMSVF